MRSSTPLLQPRHAVAALLCAVSFAIPPAAFAQGASTAQHFPTNEDLRHTRSIRDPQLSPDGHSVLVTVTEPTVDGALSHLWLVDVDHNTSRQLTFSPAGSKSSESRGRWSSDGRFVYFIAHRSDTTQLFRLPMNGGEPRAITMATVPLVDASRLPDAVNGSRDTTTPAPLPPH